MNLTPSYGQRIATLYIRDSKARKDAVGSSVCFLLKLVGALL